MLSGSKQVPDLSPRPASRKLFLHLSHHETAPVQLRVLSAWAFQQARRVDAVNGIVCRVLVQVGANAEGFSDTISRLIEMRSIIRRRLFLNQLDPAVLGPSFFGLVVGNGLVLTMS